MVIGRHVIGVVAGVVSAGLVIAGVEYAGHALTEGSSMFAVAIIGYGLGALVGTAVSAFVSDGKAAWLVPIILAALAAFNLFAFPHPSWFVPAALVALAIGWYVGGRIGSARSQGIAGHP